MHFCTVCTFDLHIYTERGKVQLLWMCNSLVQKRHHYCWAAVLSSTGQGILQKIALFIATTNDDCQTLGSGRTSMLKPEAVAAQTPSQSLLQQHLSLEGYNFKLCRR